MRIKHDSWWIKWAYLLSEDWRRPEAGDIINLCPLFWRIVLLTPIKCMGFILISPILAIPAIAVVMHMGLAWLWNKSDDKREKVGETLEDIGDKFINPLFEGAHALVKRFCPRVKVE